MRRHLNREQVGGQVINKNLWNLFVSYVYIRIYFCLKKLRTKIWMAFTEKMQPPDRPLSAAEWKKLKESQGNSPRFDIQMMGSLFTCGAQLDIAK